MEQLLALQELQFDSRARAAESKAAMEKRRNAIPAAILAHYERLVMRGKKGVAIARNGVCSECHLRIIGGKLLELSTANDVHLCDNCGRYLYLPVDEPAGQVETRPRVVTPVAPAKRRSRKAAAHAH